MKDKNGIIGGATFLGVGAFVSKLLGAIYRVPLTALIGAKGLGIYQMVFPVYALLLDFSGAGLPSALSKLISENQTEKKEKAFEYLNVSIRLFFVIGLFLSVCIGVFSTSISVFQGDKNARLAYMFLAPAIVLVALISCFRGYFQGLSNMKPTAVSQIIEQFIKLIFGLIFAYVLRNNVIWAVAGATFSITISELVALIYLYVKYKKTKNLEFAFNKTNINLKIKELIKTVAPITLIGIMIPLSQVIDSFVVLNILKSYRSDATALYGLLTGVVATIINLPVSICYGISCVTIPAIAGENERIKKQKNIKRVMILTLIIAIPCAVLISLFAPVIIKILFSRLNNFEHQIAISLLRISAVNVVLLSTLQTTNAILIGKGQLYKPVLSLSIGILVRTVFNVLLVKNEQINIYGGAISIIACYFIICLINLIMIYRKGEPNESRHAYRREYAS